MPFPEVDRIIYKNNPLDNVICQFRFPPILKIDKESPAEFQDLIRDQFPYYLEKEERVTQITVVNPQIPLPPIHDKGSKGKNYEFLDEDKRSKINITRNFIAFSTPDYTKWEDFFALFEMAFKRFTDIYKPTFITRVGLRYTDVFDRELLGLEKAKWEELLNPQFLGLLVAKFSDNIKDFESIYEITLTII